MNSGEIRRKFLKYFEKRKHKAIPSSSLLSDDPSVLLTTAGVQQFKPYYTGERNPEKDLGSRRAVSVQKSFRTSDIDQVGDQTHLTFFEMLGNFSFGDYWKKEAIVWAYEFLIKELKVAPGRISVSIFSGDNHIPRDDESDKIWREEVGLPGNKIREAGKEDNFWGPTGNQGPCGPTTEIHIDGVEVWNIVFNEYFCDSVSESDEKIASPVTRNDDGRGPRNDDANVGDASPSQSVIAKPPAAAEAISGGLKLLKTRGVDTGMGLERLTAALNKVGDIYQTDVLKPLIGLLPEKLPIKEKRIIADHIRAAAFLIADGVRPSNKEAGYVLRRLIRRLSVIASPGVRHCERSEAISSAIASPEKESVIASPRGAKQSLFITLINQIISIYKTAYPELNSKIITSVFNDEQDKFSQTLKRGLKELDKFDKINAQDAFKLYETFGLPFEAIKDYGGVKTADLKRTDFDKEFNRHQQISRAGAEKKFGGHGLAAGANNGEGAAKIIRLHTATHLLQQALRDVLGAEVRQMGSDVNSERTRFDFSFNRKLAADEIKEAERIVNQKIKENLPVNFIELPLAKAKKTGALHFFQEKYPDTVKVYYIGDSLKNAYSKEFCGGPHVKRTGEIGKFKILKEESAGAGVRRLRAAVK